MAHLDPSSVRSSSNPLIPFSLGIKLRWRDNSIWKIWVVCLYFCLLSSRVPVNLELWSLCCSAVQSRISGWDRFCMILDSLVCSLEYISRFWQFSAPCLAGHCKSLLLWHHYTHPGEIPTSALGLLRDKAEQSDAQSVGNCSNHAPRVIQAHHWSCYFS